MRRFLAPLMFAMLVVAHGAWSRQPTSSQIPQGASSQQASATAAAPSEEAQILRAQLEQMRDTDQKLLSTVHWSLGTLALLAVLLVGFNWYVNFRQYERDKERLAAELRDQIGKTLTTSVDAVRTDLVREIGRRATDLEAKMTASANALRTGLLRLQYDQLGMQADDWAKQGVYANSFTTLEEQFGLAIQLDSPFHINDSLDRIGACLRAMLKGAASPLPTHHFNKVMAMLKDLSLDYRLNVNLVQDLLEQMMRLPNPYQSLP